MQKSNNLSSAESTARIGKYLAILAFLFFVQADCVPNPCFQSPCDDNDPCTTDTCVEVNGVANCTNTFVDCARQFCNPDDGECVDCLTDADCDNRAFCDGDETCTNNNTCLDGTPPCLDDERCEEANDECVVVCTSDASCDDSLFCNGDETCLPSGLCESSGDPCDLNAAEICNEATDTCDSRPIDCNSNGDCPDDGIFCTGRELCDSDTFTCKSAGNPCSSGQTCDEVNDVCVGGDCFEPNQPITRTISVSPPTGTSVFGVQEDLPEGWSASAISDNGEYDANNSSVKWFFLDDAARTLTYSATPDGGADGEQCFEGEINFDGNTTATLEADCLEPCQQATIAKRSIRDVNLEQSTAYASGFRSSSYLWDPGADNGNGFSSASNTSNPETLLLDPYGAVPGVGTCYLPVDLPDSDHTTSANDLTMSPSDHTEIFDILLRFDSDQCYDLGQQTAVVRCNGTSFGTDNLSVYVLKSSVARGRGGVYNYARDVVEYPATHFPGGGPGYCIQDFSDSGHFLSLGTRAVDSSGTYEFGPKLGADIISDLRNGDGNPAALLRLVVSGSDEVDIFDAGLLTNSYAKPSKASFPSPGHNATNVSLNADLNWADANNTESYAVYFGTDPTPGSGEFKGNRSVSNYPLGQLAPGTDYYWRIDTQNACTETIGSTWHFKTVPCLYSLSPSSADFDASGGSGEFYVVTEIGCSWSGSDDSSWITGTNDTGNGDGLLTYTVLSNSSTSSRTGHITVGGKTHTVTQSGMSTCSYSLSPASKTFDADGGYGSFAVSTGSNCFWMAHDDSSWIGGATESGTGNGTVTYYVASNSSASSRTGHVTAGGKTHTVIQAGMNSCSYLISPTSETFDADGGSGSFSISADSGCNWSASDDSSWISGATESGSGDGTITYNVASNSNTSSRIGHVSAGGKTHTVTQSGLTSCSYSISPPSTGFGSSGGSGSINISTGSGCDWSGSDDANWISGTSDTGTGSGTLTYNVSTNTSTDSRTGHITVGGKTHTVSQSGANCSYSISPSSKSFDFSGGAGSISVSTGSGCGWSGSDDRSWISGTSDSGTGDGTLTYNVAANSSASSRTGRITIQGEIHTITQAGNPEVEPSTPYHAADFESDYCNCADCEDNRLRICEAIGYAAAWRRGDHNNSAAAIRGLYLWVNGECYLWDDDESNWMSDDCK